MADSVTISRTSADVSPIVVGILGATALVVAAAVTALSWACCRRRGGDGSKPAASPPYRLVHMLKGVTDIYGAGEKRHPMRGKRGSEQQQQPPQQQQQQQQAGSDRHGKGGAAAAATLNNNNNNVVVVRFGSERLAPATALCSPDRAGGGSGGGGLGFGSGPVRTPPIIEPFRHVRNGGGAFPDKCSPSSSAAAAVPASSSSSSSLSSSAATKAGSPHTPPYLSSLSSSSSSSSSSSAAAAAAGGSAPPEDQPLGALCFSVEYNFARKALVVTIQGARGLPAMDGQTGSSDPYVKMTILPEKKHKVKTRVLRRTLDPSFDETFTFYGVPHAQLQGLVLHFLVLSFDRFSRDDAIGEVMAPLAGVELGGDKVTLTRDIVKRNIQKSVGRGELLLSLCYQPSTSRLTVVVLKARHLPKTDIAALSDPYVKVNVHVGNKRVAKKRTHVKRCTLNPVYNESFAFDAPGEWLSELSVECLVVNSDRVTKSEVIGRLVLGHGGAAAAAAAGVSAAAEHWREIFENPRRQVAKWHCLGEF
ncbi:synaptotagmin-11-like isoform X1 [Lethenteron reissneri]|uniref:synaptotagmin-11-like isoform X1 n=1 Tax=Lethenteron reissneri TaxID=7753 RepID=UPI002AB79900|nr:synaptotagmin-11-like isoform X1 [Lethenteron reissneri]